MNAHRTVMILVLAGSSMILSACATVPSDERPMAGPGTTAPSASSDPNQACLARIPKDATPGQRDMAERSCARDEAERKAALGVGSRAASGTEGDTLEACLARIPNDASAGQRMIAERSCHRDAGR